MDNQYEVAKKKILKDFLKIESNVIHIEKMFMANSVLKWASEQNASKDVFIKYVSFIQKYLQGEIDLYWEGGIIKIVPSKKTKR